MPLVVTGSGSDLSFLLLIFSFSTYLLLGGPLGQKKKISGVSKGLLFEEIAVLLHGNTFPFHFFFFKKKKKSLSRNILHSLEVRGFLA